MNKRIVTVLRGKTSGRLAIPQGDQGTEKINLSQIILLSGRTLADLCGKEHEMVFRTRNRTVLQHHHQKPLSRLETEWLVGGLPEAGKGAFCCRVFHARTSVMCM